MAPLSPARRLRRPLRRSTMSINPLRPGPLVCPHRPCPCLPRSCSALRNHVMRCPFRASSSLAPSTTRPTRSGAVRASLPVRTFESPASGPAATFAPSYPNGSQFDLPNHSDQSTSHAPGDEVTSTPQEHDSSDVLQLFTRIVWENASRGREMLHRKMRWPSRMGDAGECRR